MRLNDGYPSDEVKKLQHLLGINEDGLFGPETEDAVKRFQRFNHLDIDGIVGPETWNKLFYKGWKIVDNGYMKEKNGIFLRYTPNGSQFLTHAYFKDDLTTKIYGYYCDTQEQACRECERLYNILLSTKPNSI